MTKPAKLFRYSILSFLIWAAPGYAAITVNARHHPEQKTETATIPAEQSKKVRRARPISRSWLKGTWEGTAYQSNNKENWALKLTVRNRSYRVDYPSLSCGGNWKLIRMGTRTAKFREKLTYGQTECVDNVTVTIQKLNSKQVVYWYVEPKQWRVNGIAVLDKQ